MEKPVNKLRDKCPILASSYLIITAVARTQHAERSIKVIIIAGVVSTYVNEDYQPKSLNLNRANNTPPLMRKIYVKITHILMKGISN